MHCFDKYKNKSCQNFFFQFLDIWWSTLDIMNDFKPIFKMGFSPFSEIKQSLFFIFFQIVLFLELYYRIFCLNILFPIENTSFWIKNNDCFISSKLSNKFFLEIGIKSSIISYQNNHSINLCTTYVHTLINTKTNHIAMQNLLLLMLLFFHYILRILIFQKTEKYQTGNPEEFQTPQFPKNEQK